MTIAPLQARFGDPKHSIGLWSAFAPPPEGGGAKPMANAVNTNPFYLTYY